MTEIPVFIVNCERIGRRSHYYVRFKYNEQLVEKIKNLPKDTRKWSAIYSAWEIQADSLLLLMKEFKGSDKIFFNFNGIENKNIFIEIIKKIEKQEAEKKELIKELNKNKEQWIERKKELETTYELYREKIENKLRGGIKLYPHQIVGTMFLNETKNCLLALDMGTGKAQPLDSKVLTPHGWVKMGDICVNDYVIGSDGQNKRVIGVFPQGIKKIYKIIFNDGTSTQCCDEHLWDVNSPTRNMRSKNNKLYPYKTLTLSQIKEIGLYDKNNNRKHYIPIVKPIDFEEKILKIHPYVLGCILGDGGISSKNRIVLTSIDEELINYVSDLLPINHELRKIKSSSCVYGLISNNQKRNDMNQAIKYYELNGKTSHFKFIPNDYKYSSINQRIELLQGLLDTDGHASIRDGNIEITLASQKLIEDIQFIVQSLGGIGRIKPKTILYKNEKRTYYRLLIKLPPQFKPFKLTRKLINYKPPTKYLPNRAISKIEYVGEKEAQCIYIDSDDHLYVTDNCILTHNTIISIAYSEINDFEKVFVITPNSLKFNFYNEVDKFTNSKAHIIKWKNNKYSIEESKYIIVNYEYFNSSDRISVVNKVNKLNIGNIDCLIIDECHRIKSSKSNSYKNIKSIFSDKIFKNNKPSKIFMSGTPAPSRAMELYTVLNQISPLDFPSKNYFYEHYLGMTYDFANGWGWTVDETKTKFEELFNKISPFTYRKKKSEVLKDLPEKSYERVMLEMTEKEYQVYYDLEEGVANEFVNKELTNPLSIMGKLREYTSFLKVKNVKELIDSIIESGEKFVAIDFYKESLRELHKAYPDISGLHTGDIKDIERSEIVNEFQDNDGKIKVFLGSESTTKEGLTLTAASKVGMLTIPWTPGTLDQCTDRLCRIGQKNAVNAYVFIFKDTIDEYIFNLIESKRAEISQVIDGENYESNVNQSIMNDLIKIIKNKHKK